MLTSVHPGVLPGLAVLLSIAAVPLSLFLIKAYHRVKHYRNMSDYFAGIIDSANEGMYVTDKERRFLFWNEAAERITGYRKEDVVGRSCHDNILCHTDRQGGELCRNRCPLNTAMETGTAHGPDIVFLRQSNGRKIPVEVKTAPLRSRDGKIIGGVEVFQDVSARLEQDRLLRERKAKLETVLDCIGDGILFLDTKGTVTGFNHACSELFGLGKSVIGTELRLLRDEFPLRKALESAERDFALFIARYGIALNSDGCPESGSRFRCWNRGIGRTVPDGRSECFTCDAYQTAKTFLERPREITWNERTFSVVSSFIEVWETNELGEIITFHDVTAEKLDAALKVAGAAAHELRQPLQVVLMLAGIFKQELRGDPAFREYIHTLETSCNRMDRIIHQMGDLGSYRTKEYVEGARILDIDHSFGNR